MKRILSLALSLALLLLLTACAAEEAEDGADGSQAAVQEAETAMRWDSSTTPGAWRPWKSSWTSP